MHRLLKSVFIIVLLLIISLVFYISAFDLNKHREKIQTAISQALHRDVELVGDMSLGISLKPTIVLHDVHIHNPEWASRSYLASIDTINLEFDLLPILNSKFRVTNIEITGADIQLESHKDGRDNWLFRTEKSSRTGISFPGIKYLKINNSSITRIAENEMLKKLDIKSASLFAELNDPLKMKIIGNYQNSPLEISVTTGKIDMLEDKWPVIAAIMVRDNSLEFDGVLHKDIIDGGLTGKLRFHGKEASTLAPVLGVALPDTGGYDLSAEISINTEKYQASDIKIDIDYSFNKQHLSVSDGNIIVGKNSATAINLNAVYAGTAYEIGLSGGTLEDIFTSKEAWPISASIKSAGALLKLDGAVSELLVNNTVDLNVVAKGDDISVLGPLLGMQLPQLGKYFIDAQLSGQKNKYASLIRKANIHGAEIKGDVQIDLTSVRPKIITSLTAGHVRLGDRLQKKSGDKPTVDAAWLDMPINIKIPTGVDVDFNIKADKISGLPLVLQNINVRGHLANGALSVAPASWRMPGGTISAKIDMTHQDNIPLFALDITAKGININKITKALKYETNPALTLKRVNLQLNGSGGNVRDLLNTANINVNAKQATINLPTKKHARTLKLDKISINSRGNNPLSLSAKGAINGLPLSVEIKTDALINRLGEVKPLPIDIKATFSDMHINVKGRIDDIVNLTGIDLNTQISGKQLKSLEPESGTKLLAIGPYQVSAQLSDVGDVYRFNKLAGNIGRTDVRGDISIKKAEKRPFVTVHLQSDKLYYRDFFRKKIRTEPASGKTHSIPDHKIPVKLLRSVDGLFDIQSKHLFVNEVEYSNFMMNADLNDGELNIKRMKSVLEGGDIDVALKIITGDDLPVVFLKLQATNIDYGELLETLSITDKMSGKAEVSVSISGQGEGTRALLSHANGTIHLVSEKGKISQSKLDLWAADLVTTALTSAWQVENVTNVNCIVGRADIIDGILKTDSLLMDTQRITIAGSGTHNFATDELNFLITPAPKNPSFVSLAKPVRLTGSLNNPTVAAFRSSRAWTLGGVLAGLANPGTLLFMYGKLGTSAENPCLETLKKRELTEQQAQQAGQREPDRLPSKFFDFIRHPVDTLTK